LWINGDNFDHLVDRVRDHRRYKGLDPVTVEEDIVQQVCMRLGPAACREYEEYYPDKTDRVDAEMMQAINKTAINYLKSGMSLADEEEVQRRAEICRGCPFNVSAQGCSCSVFFKIVESLISKEKRLPGVNICSVCGCSLQLKTRFPSGTIDNGDLSFPAWCWQRLDNEV